MEETLRAALRTAFATSAGGRVDWGLRPQGAALPALTLTLVSRVRDQTYAGRSRLVMSRVQVDLWAASYAAAKTLARALVVATDALGGPGKSFAAVLVDGERDDVEADGPDPIHRTMIDLIIWHDEP